MSGSKISSFGSQIFILVTTMIIAFFILAGVTSAGLPMEEWNRTFGGPDNNDEAYFVQETSDGGYILAGNTGSYGAGEKDAWLIKTDSEGFEVWNRTFGGNGSDTVGSVHETANGGFILAGFTSPKGSEWSDAWLIKTDSEGFEEWNRTYEGGEGSMAYSVQETKDGGYIVLSSSTSTELLEGGILSRFDAWLIKTDSEGFEEWNRTFGGRGIDIFVSFQETADGGYILAGYTEEDYETLIFDAWLIKTDSNGVEEWNRTFGGGGIDTFGSVHETADGGYILGGFTSPKGSESSDAWLVKTDSKGVEEWNRTLGDQDVVETVCSARETKDGGYIVLSSSISSESLEGNIIPRFSASLTKTDSKGFEEWNRTFEGLDIFIAHTLQETSDGGYVFTASRLEGRFMEGQTDAVLVKVGDERSTPGFEIFTGLASGALIAVILVLRRERE
ncbi:MAG: hypothetical protein SVY15_02820 [Halobacteriota archaeon]|nr:hypothetical protein [Halobacteriota archaeon]